MQSTKSLEKAAYKDCHPWINNLGNKFWIILIRTRRNLGSKKLIKASSLMAIRDSGLLIAHLLEETVFYHLLSTQMVKMALSLMEVPRQIIL
jgi:hypothetical protein